VRIEGSKTAGRKNPPKGGMPTQKTPGILAPDYTPSVYRCENWPGDATFSLFHGLSIVFPHIWPNQPTDIGKEVPKMV
jgi:hypothetical protein